MGADVKEYAWTSTVFVAFLRFSTTAFVHPPVGEKKTWMSAAWIETAKKRASRTDFMRAD
jgi:hypothetical protein